MVTKNLISVALSLVVLTVASVASNVDVDVLPTPQNSNSIHTIIESQKRYVLFNSRRLSGDCLPTCIVETRSVGSTDAPLPPTDAPTDAPVGSECGCETDDATAGSFKCGNDVYICPGITEICSNQDSQNSVYYELTMAQCTAMKGVAIDTKCVPLPQYNLLDTKDLSNRVCYGGSEFGNKRDGEGCGACTGFETPVFEETTAPVDTPTDAPVDPTDASVDPTGAPVDPADAPVSNCECDHDDSRIGSWKCGKNIYVCPGFTEICKNQVKPQFSYYPLDADQCEEMKSKRLGEKCILLPDYGITSDQGLGLSNRVCYDADHPFGTKTDDSTCGGDCTSTKAFVFEEPVRRRRWF